MDDLAQAVAFLESLNLAHGDLRPENVLLDRNRLKLSDFDCTAKFGINYEACIAPYGRLLNNNESDQGECGTPGFLSPRTELFALGSLYYWINYGFEVYGDRCLTEDPYEHGPKVVDLLQNMEFPKLDGNPPIDNINEKCWHNKYVTVSELAAHTKTLNERSDNRHYADQDCTEEEFLSRKEFCQDLEKRGLLQALSSGEPEQIGFTFDWYRHSLQG
jgi:serine/threonine protein kinase